MLRLYRYILREIIWSALLGTFLFSVVLVFQKMAKLFELLVNSSASAGTVGYLFTLTLPTVLIFALPLGVLVGTLIGLSRMSADGEMVALRAVGVPTRRVLWPVLFLGVLSMIATAAASTWLTPLSIRETFRLRNDLAAAMLTAEILPRVFQEGFPQRVLYVRDVLPGTPAVWNQVFIADLSPPEQRTGPRGERGDAPRITVAKQAIATVDADQNRIQLSLRDGATYETGKDPADYFISSFPSGEQLLEAPPPDRQEAKPYSAMDMGPLYQARDESVDARIEFHQRLALPFACILFTLVGVPLGVSTQRSGKSAAFVITVFLAFLYYLGFISMIGLARQGSAPAGLAVWIPNICFAFAGSILLFRLERPGDRDFIAGMFSRLSLIWTSLRRRLSRDGGDPVAGARPSRRVSLLPQILDAYILSKFLFYFAALLASFVVLVEVFTFFELLGDIVKNGIPLSRVLTYLFFLAPKLIYDSTPMSVLVAVLITFGILAKHNEVTAFLACGVSIYRLALPILAASIFLSTGLFAFDYYYVPKANRIQDAIRDEIKGRPVQTYFRPERKWIFGKGSSIYFYRYLDPSQVAMQGVHVYDLDPRTNRLRRHISAEVARWSPPIQQWVFENGWVREMEGIRTTSYEPFQARTFTDLEEEPNWFLREMKLDKQMNFHELSEYITELSQTGFDTSRLRVQYHRKFSVPLFAMIMAILSIPFAFLAGNRGAMTGVAASLGIAAAYWGISQLFEQAGNVQQLTAAVAAWSPDALFTLTGGYLISRMRT